MGQRNKQHMGRSNDDDRDLVGRDVRDGDATADAAERTALPMPNEEGTDFRPDGAAADGAGVRDRGDVDSGKRSDGQADGGERR